jgi:hypothetical protein
LPAKPASRTFTKSPNLPSTGVASICIVSAFTKGTTALRNPAAYPPESPAHPQYPALKDSSGRRASPLWNVAT